jgi:hypothetical protein
MGDNASHSGLLVSFPREEIAGIRIRAIREIMREVSKREAPVEWGVDL